MAKAIEASDTGRSARPVKMSGLYNYKTDGQNGQHFLMACEMYVKVSEI